MKKWGYKWMRGTILPGGRVSRQSQRVHMRGGCKHFLFIYLIFFDILNHHFEKYVIVIVIVNIPKFFLKNWIFANFSRKFTVFMFRHALWRHNYVTPWQIVLIYIFLSGQFTYGSRLKCGMLWFVISLVWATYEQKLFYFILFVYICG